MPFPRNGQIFFSARSLARLFAHSFQSWRNNTPFLFSFLMQTQNGFSYLFVNAAAVSAFIYHGLRLRRRRRRKKLIFAPARSIQPCDAITLYRELESGQVDSMHALVHTHTNTQLTFLWFVISWFSACCWLFISSLFSSLSFFHRNLIELIASICST